MNAIELSLTSGSPLPTARNSIAGGPILPSDIPLPKCTCGETMLLFLHFDIPALDQLNFAANCHLSVFMCPVHNENSDPCLGQKVLPHDYWNLQQKAYSPNGSYLYPIHHRLFLLPIGKSDVKHPPGSTLLQQRLFANAITDAPGEAWWESEPGVPSDYQNISALPMKFKIGGLANWINDPPRANTCCCGAPMRFLCQIPDNFAFPMSPEAPCQPDSFSVTDYCLFLGNIIYIFACEDRCHPNALIAYNDN